MGDGLADQGAQVQQDIAIVIKKGILRHEGNILVPGALSLRRSWKSGLGTDGTLEAPSVSEGAPALTLGAIEPAE